MSEVLISGFVEFNDKKWGETYAHELFMMYECVAKNS